jgi:hypothetical protein
MSNPTAAAMVSAIGCGDSRSCTVLSVLAVQTGGKPVTVNLGASTPTKDWGSPFIFIPDRARIHTAKAIAPYLELLKSQGVTLCLLLAYCPELNRMENSGTS